MNFHLYASINDSDTDDLSPATSLLSRAPTSQSKHSHRSIKRAFHSIRYRCHRIKQKLHLRHKDVEEFDTTCEQFDFPYPSPLTFNFASMQYEAASAVADDDGDWYTTLATTLRRGYVEYDMYN